MMHLRSRRSIGTTRARLATFVVVVGTAILGATAAWSQSVTLPHTVADISFTNAGESVDVLVDLATLPIRPRIRAVATPDASHADMTLDLRILDCGQEEFFFPRIGDPPTDPPPYLCHDYYDWRSDLQAGEASVLAELWECLPDPTNLWSARPDTCTVRLTADDLGASPPPATVDLSLTSATRIVTGSAAAVVDLSPTPPVTVELPASKDATIYQDTSTANGAGQFLVTGGGTDSPFGFPELKRALIAFELEDGGGNPIPFGSDVLSASLTVDVSDTASDGFDLELYRMDPSRDWVEGGSDPSGSEIHGTLPTGGDATWFEYESPNLSWTSPGGDFLTPASASLTTFSTGPVSFSGPGLLADLEDMIDAPAGTSRNQGWLIEGPPGTLGSLPFFIHSRETPNSAQAPKLTIEYQENFVTQLSVDVQDVTFKTNVDNFRWIYDPDPTDEVYAVTTVDPDTGSIQGECVALDTMDVTSPPFAHTFLGVSTFEGHDCCTWQYDVPDGTTATGQAVFHLNLPLEVPVPDWDGDGIGNPCDNCRAIPNGPDGGTCVPASGEADGLSRCLSDQDCSGGDTCSLAQEDQDGDRVGDACPEPGATLMLSAGLLGLAGLARRRGAGVG